MDDPSPTPRRRRWPLIAAGACILALLIAGAWWLAGTGVYTDDQGIRIRASQARLRQFLWTAPQGLPPTIDALQQEYEPALSPDGAELYFVRGKPGENADLFVSRRLNNQWTAPQPVAAINTKHDELGPCLTPDGQSILFYSDRPGGSGQYDLWIAGRTADGWSEPRNLGPGINSRFNDYSPAVTPDGKRLFFASNRKAAEKLGPDAWRATIRQGEIGDYDLYAASLSSPATRPATQPSSLAFGAAAEVIGVNTPSHEGACAISPAGDFLYFASNRPGGRGGFDLYRARLHPSPNGALPPLVAESLGGEINTPANETDPRLADGGFRLYFSSDRAGDHLYRLFTSESREVYAARDRLPLPLGWSWWLLLLSLALLVPLLLMLNGPENRHLTLIQKCLLISLLVHILLTLLSTSVIVTRQIIASVREGRSDAMRIDLASAKAAEVAMQVRTQVTDLQAPTPAMSEIERIQMPDIAVIPPKPVEIKLPDVQRQPPAMQLHAATPAVAPPRPSERVDLTPPAIKLDAPAIVVAPPRPVLDQRDEPRLADPLPPAPAQLAPQLPASVQVTPAQVRIQDRPVDLPASSLAEAAAVTPAKVQAVDPVAVVRPEIELKQPDLANPVAIRAPVTSTEPDAPRVSEAAVEFRPQESAAPVVQPAFAQAAVAPTTRPAESLAQAAAISQPRLAPAGVAAPSALVEPAAVAPIVTATAPRPRPIADASPDIPPAIASKEPPDPLRAQAIPAASAAGLRPAPVSISIPLAVSSPRIDSPVRIAVAPIRPVIPGLLPDTPGPTVGPVPVWARPDGLELPANLAQRSFEQRQELLKQLGGTPDSEAAVARALAYLARNQEPDGRWTNIDRERRRKAQRDEHDSALTALACLAYLGSDHTPAKPGPYQAQVTRAMDWLLSIEKNGDLRNGGDMYDQGIATIALAEAALMTDNPSYRAAALRAGRFIERAIDQRTGGWRYIPGTDGDTSVLGWQLMALKSVAGLGQETPDAIKASALRFLDSASYGRHRMLAAYQAGAQRPSNAMAAEGAFARILLGQHFTDPQREEVTGHLLKNLPGQTPADFYYWYYASLALRQLQGEAWTAWNPHMRDTLVKLQEKGGALDGSWDFDKSRHGNRAGRVYSTAIATLTLEVYYRYLPMYNARE